MRNKIFASLVILLFILGLFLAFGNNNTVLKIENREAAKYEDIKDDSIFTGTHVDELNTVLSDQMFMRDKLINLFYRYKFSMNRYMPEIKDEETGEVKKVAIVSDEVVEFGNGYLTRNINDVDWDAEIENAANRGYNLHEIYEKYAGIKMYVYMPTKIEQTHLIDDKFKENRFDEIEKAFVQQLWGGIKFKKMEYESIEDYEQYYYRTDIHWNIKGSYRGYQEIIKMIQEDFDIEDPKPIISRTQYGYDYYGGNARKIGNAVERSDHITDYDLGISEDDYKYYFDGYCRSISEIKEKYRENGMEGKDNVDDYVIYFDTFTLRRVFDFDQEDKPNLLIFGDSYVNPVMPWIASHFNKTVILDMRFLTEDFSLDEIMKKYDIDAVLNLQYYDNLFFNGNCFIPVEH